MASGCLVIGSRTGPVEEVITQGDNGLLVDFFNVSDMADRVTEALENQTGLRPLRDKAQAHVRARYNFKVGEQAYQRLLQV